MGLDREAILANWLALENIEKRGNKELGIRGRHDARVRTNYIMAMPNTLNPEQCLQRVENIIQKTPIAKCTYTIVVHKGEKAGIVNQHIHLLVNERYLDTRLKDREMQRKQWLASTLKPLYEREFRHEFFHGPTVAPRDRISQGLFESAPHLVRAALKKHNEPKVKPSPSFGKEVLPILSTPPEPKEQAVEKPSQNLSAAEQQKAALMAAFSGLGEALMSVEERKRKQAEAQAEKLAADEKAKEPPKQPARIFPKPKIGRWM